MSASNLRLGEANEALATFTGTRLDKDASGRLWIVNESGRRTIGHLSEQGNWPLYPRRVSGGGTQQQAIAQLIRYVRFLPRLPLDTWRYWASEKIRLCNQETVSLLAASAYGEESATKCVLCGCPNTAETGLDWWSLDGVTGPCCSAYGRKGCRQGMNIAPPPPEPKPTAAVQPQATAEEE